MRKQSLRAGAAYFAMVFGAGALIGPVREFALTPRVGPTFAVMIETPIMLAVSIVCARWVMRHWPQASPGLVGASALGMLLVAETGGAIWLRRMSLSEYAAHLATPAGLISLSLFASFALMPLIIGRRPG